MRPLHRVLLVLAAFIAFHGVQACASETNPGAELNPQPLPPETGEDNKNTGPEAQEPGSATGGGATSSSGSSSSSGGPPMADADGGTGDGGDSGGDN